MNEILDAIATTRAIRRIRPDPIPDADLSKILFAATRAPSNSNRQRFRFLVLRDAERARAAKACLGDAFRASWARKRGAEGYDEGSGRDPSSRKARMANAMQDFVDNFESVPVVVLACLTLDHAAGVADGASIFPACQNLLVAARSLGYGGVLTAWHHLVEPELREILDIPDGVLIAATIPLGRPKGSHGPVRRRPLGELVYDDRWGSEAVWTTEPEGTRHSGRPQPR